MARIIPQKPVENEIDCGNCQSRIGYLAEEIKSIWSPGFREPELIKSWIVCPACNKKITIKG